MSNFLRNQLEIGTNSSGLTLFREFDFNKGFTNPCYLQDDNNLQLGSRIIVNYIELYKDADGVETDLLKKLRENKCYILQDQVEVKDENDNIIQVEWKPVTMWTQAFSRGGVTIPEGDGILDNIETILKYVLPTVTEYRSTLFKQLDGTIVPIELM
jgi:hypothetical protein